MVLPFFFLLFLPDVLAFKAFSCDSKYKSYMRFNSLSVEECSLGSDWISEQKEIDIQVLYLQYIKYKIHCNNSFSKNSSVKVVQSKFAEEMELITCSLERTLEIGKCGFTNLKYGVIEKPVSIFGCKMTQELQILILLIMCTYKCLKSNFKNRYSTLPKQNQAYIPSYAISLTTSYTIWYNITHNIITHNITHNIICMNNSFISIDTIISNNLFVQTSSFVKLKYYHPYNCRCHKV